MRTGFSERCDAISKPFPIISLHSAQIRALLPANSHENSGADLTRNKLLVVVVSVVVIVVVAAATAAAAVVVVVVAPAAVIVLWQG